MKRREGMRGKRKCARFGVKEADEQTVYELDDDGKLQWMKKRVNEESEQIDGENNGTEEYEEKVW